MGSDEEMPEYLSGFKGFMRSRWGDLAAVSLTFPFTDYMLELYGPPAGFGGGAVAALTGFAAFGYVLGFMVARDNSPRFSAIPLILLFAAIGLGFYNMTLEPDARWTATENIAKYVMTLFLVSYLFALFFAKKYLKGKG